jgi:hypothetical protein
MSDPSGENVTRDTPPDDRRTRTWRPPGIDQTFAPSRLAVTSSSPPGAKAASVT